MEIARWKEHPELWEKVYRSITTSSLRELGYSSFNNVEITVGKPPSELEELTDTIKRFWQDFLPAHPGMKNLPLYGIRGTKDVSMSEKTLNLQVFPTSYAAIRFKNSLNLEHNLTLTSSQRDFLDNHFLVLGIEAYVVDSASKEYLFGIRSDPGDRNGLYENIPRGLVDPLKDNDGNIFHNALERHLLLETGLSLSDLDTYRATHLTIGPKYGDFTLVFKADVNLAAKEKCVANPRKHQQLAWSSYPLVEEGQPLPSHFYNPGTTALFEKLNLP